ncbi:hypothetical protein MTO96_004933 [Rhipicephalus appendiculatus]
MTTSEAPSWTVSCLTRRSTTSASTSSRVTSSPSSAVCPARQQGNSVACTPDKFAINVDTRHFTPEEITVKTQDNSVVIHGKHEEKSDDRGCYVKREFTRRYVLPEDVDPQSVKCHLKPNGTLALEAPHISIDIETPGRGSSTAGAQKKNRFASSTEAAPRQQPTRWQSPPTPAPTTKTTPTPIKRPVSFIFCTVGPFSEASAVAFDSMMCDYFVYTHVLPLQGRHTVLRQQPQLGAVQEGESRATAYRDKLNYFGYPNETRWGSVKLQHYGYSFDTEDLTFLSRELSGVSSKVTKLFNDHGLLTAGMAYYDRPDGSSDSHFGTIKSLVNSVDSMLMTAQNLNTTILKTTFLGVKFAGMTASAANDASALQELLGVGKIDLLILLTHLVDVPSDPNCKILQLSRYSGDALDAMEPPSMNLRHARGRYNTHAAPISDADDRSELCSVSDANITENTDPMSSSAFYRNTADGIFMVFETKNATRLKTSKASNETRAKGVDLTWAAYDVNRDVMNCGVGKAKGRTLEVLSAINDTVVADYAPKDDDDRRRIR